MGLKKVKLCTYKFNIMSKINILEKSKWGPNLS